MRPYQVYAPLPFTFIATVIPPFTGTSLKVTVLLLDSEITSLAVVSDYCSQRAIELHIHSALMSQFVM